jgi:hypothetical protein
MQNRIFKSLRSLGVSVSVPADGAGSLSGRADLIATAAVSTVRAVPYFYSLSRIDLIYHFSWTVVQDDAAVADGGGVHSVGLFQMADELRLALAAELRLLQSGEPAAGAGRSGAQRGDARQLQWAPVAAAAAGDPPAASGADENAQSLAKTVQVRLNLS